MILANLVAGLMLSASGPATVGLNIGEPVAPFEPYWISGPYADTRQCPICEYGLLPLVVVWSQFKDSKGIKPIIEGISATVADAPNGRQKAFLVDLNAAANDGASRKNLKAFSQSCKAPNVFMMSRVGTTKAVLRDYKLAPYSDWETVVYVVKGRLVTAKFVNPTPRDLPSISEAIRATR